MNKYKLSLMTVFINLALYQSVYADEDLYLDETVISASGFSQNIKEAPASISIITKEDIKKTGVKDIGDLVKNEVGVEVSKTKVGTSQISIRGFDPQYTAILIDGKRQNSYSVVKSFYDSNGAFLPNINDIETVEVIRGPASVLYGSDAIGGVVNIITKKDYDKFGANLSLDALIQERSQYANAFTQSVKFNLPLIENKLSMSLHGHNINKESTNLRKPDGNYASHSNGRYEQYNYGGLINYNIEKDKRFFVDFDKSFESGIVNATGGSNAMYKRDFERIKSSLNYAGEHDFGSLSSSLSFNETKRVYGEKSGPFGSGGMKAEPLMNLKSQYLIFKSNLVKPFDINDTLLNLSSGFEFMHERLYDDEIVSIKDKYAKQNTISLYTEGEYFINDDFIATLGTRLSYGSIYGLALSPRAYLIYKATDDLSLKAGVSTGYKTGTLMELTDGIISYTSGTQYDTYTYGNPNLKEENSINYELAAIYDSKDIGNLNLTAFYTKFKNKIIMEYYKKGDVLPNNVICKSADDYSCKIYNNVDESHVYGIEALYKSPTFYNFNIDIAYTYAKTEIDKGRRQGQDVSETPRHSVTAKLNYQYDDFNAYLKAIAKEKTPAIDKGSTTSPYYGNYVLFDLGMNYKFDKHHDVSFIVSNLFNKDFLKFDVIDGKYSHVYKDYMEGRNYYIKYNYSF